MSNIKLRAHHVLCVYFFEEKGYDDKFVNNMSSVIALLQSNPDVTVISDEDIICFSCPNNINGRCKSKKVTRYDNAVMRLCGFENNKTLPWEEFSSIAIKNIIEEKKIFSVCSDCEWVFICHMLSCH